MTSLKEFDMHGLKYLDAQFEACRRMEEAYSEGLLGVRFIHGYKRGNDLQNYVRKASGLTRDLRRHCPELPSITMRPEGKGVTSALFEEDKG
jgi:hypothetical protein